MSRSDLPKLIPVRNLTIAGISFVLFGAVSWGTNHDRAIKTLTYAIIIIVLNDVYERSQVIISL